MTVYIVSRTWIFEMLAASGGNDEIEESAIAAKIPILRDCAAGIADVQVRNRGTIGGSLAEADPSGDWATVLLTLFCEVRCVGVTRERSLKLSEFLKDAYSTARANDE